MPSLKKLAKGALFSASPLSPPKAIWYQKILALQEEMAMIATCSNREKAIKDLKKIIHAVNDKRRELDDDTLIDTFSLFIAVRECTIDLLIYVQNWQCTFTRMKRPQLMEIDYLVEMCRLIDFVNATMVRKVFSFGIGRRNILILPFDIQRTKNVTVSTKLASLVNQFANPNVERLRSAYEVLLRSLPDQEFKKLYPLGSANYL